MCFCIAYASVAYPDIPLVLILAVSPRFIFMQHCFTRAIVVQTCKCVQTVVPDVSVLIRGPEGGIGDIGPPGPNGNKGLDAPVEAR